MIDLTLNDPDGKPVLKLKFPQEIKEVTLLQYINFLVAGRESEKAGDGQLLGMMKSVSAFFEIDLMSLMLTEYEEPGEALAPVATSLFVKLYDTLLTYKPDLATPETFKITHQGEEYILPHTIYNKITSQMQMKGLSMLEQVEVDEVKRLARIEIKKTGDVDGSIWFTEYVSMLALLLRKENEYLPLDGHDRNAFLEHRRQIFSTIDLETALRVDFFLTSGLKPSSKAPTIIGSLTLPLLLILGATLPVSRPSRRRLVKQGQKAKRLFLGRDLGGFTPQ